MDALEMQIRRLMDLPPCDCGQGLDCPEIHLNLPGHPREDEVIALLEAAGDPQDGGGPWWMEVEMEMVAERFARLCDYFWRQDHPETPKDGLLHTSDTCRKRAGEVLDLLDLEWWRRAGEGHDADGEPGSEN